jgi:amidophosphoribosyltransferase
MLDRDRFREECGIFAIWDHSEAAKLAYLGLYALQHRGQEGAGICAGDGRRVLCRKEMGLVAEIFTEAVLDELSGTAAIGHTRYSTAGDSSRLNVQPFMVECNKGQIAIAHNGNLTNAIELRRGLDAAGSIFQATSDTEVILHLVARSRERTLAAALREALLQVEGAYSLLVMSQDQLIVVRDPRGFRPLAMGRLPYNGRLCPVFASETCAFDLIGAQYQGDVEPGEMIIVGPEGLVRERFAPEQPRAHCVFEHVYFSRPDSTVFGRSVQDSREMLGRLLARESPADADIVVPVPDSGVSAALGFAAESGIPYRMGLIRNHYVGRTFIEPSQAIRDFGVKLKLNPVRSLIAGKRVVLVDDSIVRGTTSRKIVRMVRQAGAREVHLRISCPPTISPCYYGVDTPTKDELIASHQSVEEIRRFVEADSLAYLSMEGLRQAVGDSAGRFCYACYTANYPTDLVGIEALLHGSERRRA